LHGSFTHVSHTKSYTQIRAADTQTEGPWNLQAISTRQPVGGTDPGQEIYTYTYNQPIGDGVDIYIIDTGVYIEHDEFQGRASWGWTGRGLTQEDAYGHGTHVAGIAAGEICGVAKKANIIAVKVLGDDGQGSKANGVDGINWVAANVRSTGRPSIACIAWAGPHNSATNFATTVLVADRITVVVAAGNDAKDALGYSPADADAVIVVGASDMTNAMWQSSNFGDLLDLFAPGVEIASAWITAPEDVTRLTGTSQACAHVAGITAALLSQDPTLTPGPMFNKILSIATQNVITGAPAGTIKNLVYNGVSP
jgi:cerevisin